MVDRYNIYFAYNPSKIDRAIHYSAVNFVIVAGFLLQLFVLFFAYLRRTLQEATGSLGEDWSPALVRLLNGMLEPDPLKRLTASEVLDCITRL